LSSRACKSSIFFINDSIDGCSARAALARTAAVQTPLKKLIHRMAESSNIVACPREKLERRRLPPTRLLQHNTEGILRLVAFEAHRAQDGAIVDHHAA
jgi:hypothetical protein